MTTGTFGLLNPQAVLSAVEGAFAISLDGTVLPYNSYVNRVYGLRDDDGNPLVAKFYRPERWTLEAIEQEHLFVAECASAEIPVIAPMPDDYGDTVQEVTVADGDLEQVYRFALYPRMGGRNFDPETDEDWFRLGGIVGRVHQVGSRIDAPERIGCRPNVETAAYVGELVADGLVHPDIEREFVGICTSTIEAITPLFTDIAVHRVHGDCHRGNILDRPGAGLLIIDFDDMMNAPPVQDLWLLLPDRIDEAGREIAMLIDGYEQFRPFDARSLRLVEPLRFMRMIYYLAWQARQRNDLRFREENPEWGGKAFWIREVEDLREQAHYIADLRDRTW